MKKALTRTFAKAGLVVASLGSFAFAADGDPTNLREALPTSVLDSSIWVVASLVIAAVVGVKGIQLVMRLIKRV